MWKDEKDENDEEDEKGEKEETYEDWARAHDAEVDAREKQEQRANETDDDGWAREHDAEVDARQSDAGDGGAGPGMFERLSNLWTAIKTGNHSSSRTLGVPDGVDAEEFQREIVEEIAKNPAPGARFREAKEEPQLSKTLGQEVQVSTAHPEGESVANVEATDNHIFRGAGGAAGINYVSQARGRQVSLTRDTYGDTGSPVRNGLRYAMGGAVLTPWNNMAINRVYDRHKTPEEREEEEKKSVAAMLKSDP